MIRAGVFGICIGAVEMPQSFDANGPIPMIGLVSRMQLLGRPRPVSGMLARVKPMNRKFPGRLGRARSTSTANDMLPTWGMPPPVSHTAVRPLVGWGQPEL